MQLIAWLLLIVVIFWILFSPFECWYVQKLGFLLEWQRKSCLLGFLSKGLLTLNFAAILCFGFDWETIYLPLKWTYWPF